MRSEALKVLQFVHDETHRVTTDLNQKLRSKDIILSVLESVEGIGTRRTQTPLKTFGSLEAIAEAPVEALVSQCTLNESLAAAVKTAIVLSLADKATTKERLAKGQTGEAEVMRLVEDSLAEQEGECRQ